MVRQRFRGRTWYVVRDAVSTDFYRLDAYGYRFLGLLDGRRSVGEAWGVCAERDGDEAPTQPEVIELLGRLSAAHLLSGDGGLAAPAASRQRSKRLETETRSKLQNFLFVRIPLFDPDALLTRWVPMVGWVFSPLGLTLMLVVWAIGGAVLGANAGRLGTSFSGALRPDNIPLLYLAFVLIKSAHELAHGFACKAYGRRLGGGEVHTIGVMLLVFMPVPFVDASSSWAFPTRRPRVVVAAAGMLAEITVAAVAAMVWASTNEGTAHALAANAMLIAGVSSLLFNGNPLLRYDGYYLLSDLIDVPNLWNRSRDFVVYQIKTRLLGARGLVNPADTAGERYWFVSYAVASMVYRVFLYSAIVWFLAGRFFMLGLALALGAVVSFAVLPAARGVRYLLTSPEIARTRGRALGVVTAAVAVVMAPLAWWPVPDYVRAEGVAEPAEMEVVYAGGDGFVSGTPVAWAGEAERGETLVTIESDPLGARLSVAQAELDRIEARRRLAVGEDPATAQAYAEQSRAARARVERIEREISSLRRAALFRGVWSSPALWRLEGRYVRAGERLGVLADLDSVVVRAAASQQIAALLISEGRGRVQMRRRGHPAGVIGASVGPGDIVPAGTTRLPSASLGYAAGGLLPVDRDHSDPTRTSSRFFEVRLTPDAGSGLLPGQRVIARFRLDNRPLLSQWWRTLRQTVQGRLGL